MAAKRREFIKEKTGVDLKHVGQFSLDAGSTAGNIEIFIGVAQVPMGVAGPVLVNGEHARRVLRADGHG